LSLASSKTPPSAKPAFDLDYSIHDFEADPHRDTQLFFARINRAILQEGVVPGGRVLDVACGAGHMAMSLHHHGCEAWGVDPSGEMLGIGRWLFPNDKLMLVRGIGESLPFRSGSFDRVVCKGSLDHFVDPYVFMREAARIVAPEGRVVIALANYESVSCKLGLLRERLIQTVVRSNGALRRGYWEIPDDHFHKGQLSFVEGLGGSWLQLERCYGISLLWLLPRWGKLLDRLPKELSLGCWAALDRVARGRPAWADMIISVWRRYPEGAS
jgi:SAM-dependent methyltransferase